MRKLFLFSGMLSIILGIMFIAGVIDFENSTIKSLVKGNQLFAANEYNMALEAYQIGMDKDPDNPKLSYNSGQASYRLDNYQKAIEFYSAAPNKLDGYLNSGNSSLKLGDSAEDENQKLQYYVQALETYKQGILQYPENIALKYNYEYVMKKVNEMQDRNNDGQQNNDQNKDNQEENQDGNNESQEEQNRDNTQNEQGEQDDGSQQDNQSGDSEQGQNQDDSDKQDSEASEQEQNNEETQSEASKDEMNEEQNNSSLDQPDASSSEQDRREIEQVLEMLEKQEEESLKNNQQVKSPGKEEKYDW